MPKADFTGSVGYSTHQRLLTRYAMRAPEGSTIVELGTGFFSTIILSEIAAARNLRYIVYTNDQAWVNVVKSSCAPTVEWNVIRDWKQWKPTEPAYFYFLDNSELMVDRFKHIPALQEMCSYILIHDADIYPKRGLTLPDVVEQDVSRVPNTAVLQGLLAVEAPKKTPCTNRALPVPYNYEAPMRRGCMGANKHAETDGVITNMRHAPDHTRGTITNVRAPLPDFGFVEAPEVKPVSEPPVPAKTPERVSQTLSGPPKTAIVCCYTPGGDYDAHYKDYIGRLAEGVLKNSSADTLHCISIMNLEDIPNVTRLEPLKGDWKGWHIKAEIFRKDLWEGYDRVLYVDLDTIVTSNIDDILQSEDEVTMLRDFYKPQVWETGMLYFDPKIFDGLYEEFLSRNPKGKEVKDADIISNFLRRKGVMPSFFQDSFPVGSYKVDVCRDDRRWTDFSVVCFHGNPRPHEVNWSMDIVRKTKGASPRTHPVVQAVEPVKAFWPGEDVFIIGGGPSLRNVDLDRLLEGYKVLGINDGYLYECCDVCFFGDTVWHRHHKDALLEWGKPVYSTSGVSDPLVHRLNPKGTGMSNDPTKLGWNSCSGWAGLNLALHAGAKRVFLLGFDMSFDKDGESNWHPNIRKVNKNSYACFMRNQGRIHADLKLYFPEVEIFNCTTPGYDSKLQIFPKVRLEELLDVEEADLYLDAPAKV